MPTVNETLRDLSVRQAHFVERFKGGEARKLVAFYQRMESDLVAKLARRDPTAVRGRYTTLRLVKLLEDVREVLDGYGREYRADLLSSLDGFAKMEAGALVTQIAMASPVAIETVLPSAAQIRAAIRSQPFQGRLLKEYFEALDAATYARVRDAIRLGVAQGETMAQIAQRIRQATQISRRGAELVTRTAVSHVSNVARQATYEDNDDVISGVQWVATLDTRTSDLCKGLDGKVFPIDKGPRPPAHFRCLPGGTLVSARHRITSVFKRWYEGEIVVIRTAAGKELSSTPNHPILTDGGWIASGLLNVGSNVVCDGGDEAVRAAGVHDKHMPARIEEIAQAFIQSCEMGAMPMPVAAEDFHGDGIDGDIGIVASNRLLADGHEPALAQKCSQGALVAGDIGLANFTSFGDLAPVLVGLSASSGRIVRRSGDVGALTWGESGHSGELLAAPVAQINSVGSQKAINDGWRNAELVGNPSRADAGAIQGNGTAGVDTPNASIFWLDAGLAQDAYDHLVGDTSLAGDLFHGREVGVALQNEASIDLAGISASWDSRAVENGADVGNAALERGGDVDCCPPREIHLDNGGAVELRSALGEMDSGAPNAFGDDVVRDAELAREIASGTSGPVFLDQIIDIERRYFCGHVYNLETEKGFYVAEGIVTHNCRSSTVPVLKSWRELGFDVDDAPEGVRASMDGQVAESTTYSDWLKRQPASVQDEALGKTKGALFRRGGLPLEKFTDRTGAELNLEQLRERYAEAFAKAGV